eukprot:s1206_g6.t1
MSESKMPCSPGAALSISSHLAEVAPDGASVEGYDRYSYSRSISRPQYQLAQKTSMAPWPLAVGLVPTSSCFPAALASTSGPNSGKT